MRGVGVDRFAVAGNCFGALVSLDLMASEPACAAAACLMPLIADEGLGVVGRATLLRRVIGGLRSNPLARRVILPRARALAGRLDRRLGTSVSTALERGPVLVAYGHEDLRFARGVRRSIERALAGAAHPRRSDLRFLVLDEALTQFRSLPAQEAAIRTVEGFMAQVFGPV